MYKSKVVIGTWNLSGDFGHVGLKEIDKVFSTCYNFGFKTFDTAPVYGNGFIEFCLGKIFKNKNDVKINSKIGNLPFIGKDFSLRSLKSSFENTLKRLNRDSLHTLFLHNPRGEIDCYEEIINLMQKFKDEGKIRKIGLSMAKGHNYEKSILNEFDIIQSDVNLLYLDSLNLNIGRSTQFMARSPLASGLLSGMMTRDTTFQKGDYRCDWLFGGRLESLIKRIEVLKQTLVGYDLPNVAKVFLLQNDRIDKVIFGVKTLNHVKQIMENLNQNKLPDEIVSKLEDLYMNDFGLINEKHLSY